MTGSQEIPPQSDEIRRKQEHGFFDLKVQKYSDVLTDELRKPGLWIVANLEPHGYWPTTVQKQSFRGETIWILPITEDCYPAVAIKSTTRSDADCQKLLMRFVSGLSWVLDRGISVEHGFSGGSFPRPLGRPQRSGFAITSDFDLSYFPEPADDKALLALALMREGRSLNHPGYAFLSFYRVLEVAFPDGRARARWFDDALGKVTDHEADSAKRELIAKGIVDIGLHLRESGRHAIAHAAQDPIIDPDDPADMRRLSQELPIVRALAVAAIEEVFQVETSRTVYRKHLYELVGFKKLLGDELVQRLLTGEVIPDGETIELPEINVGLRNRAPSQPLLNMQPVNVVQSGKKLIVVYESELAQIQFQFGLDFEKERLEFEMLRDVAFLDEGAADDMAYAIELKLFLDALFGNGQLHVYDAKTGKLLGRKDPYLPLNMMFNPKGAEAELAWMRAMEKIRRRLERGQWLGTNEPAANWFWAGNVSWKATL